MFLTIIHPNLCSAHLRSHTSHFAISALATKMRLESDLPLSGSTALEPLTSWQGKVWDIYPSRWLSPEPPHQNCCTWRLESNPIPSNVGFNHLQGYHGSKP